MLSLPRHTRIVRHTHLHPHQHDHHLIVPAQPSPLSDSTPFLTPPSPAKPSPPSAASLPSLEPCIPALSLGPLPPPPAACTSKVKMHLRLFFSVVLPLSLVVGVINADLSNLDFVHLVQIKAPVPADDMTLPADHVLQANLLQWTFLQSAYLLPIMLFCGAILILEFVLLVGRLRPSRLVDGLNFTMVLTLGVVGLMTLLNAFVGTSVVAIIFTKMFAALFVCSAMGLVVQAVELLPYPSLPTLSSNSRLLPAAVGFSPVMFSIIYGLGTAFSSCSTLAGYQLASVLQRHNITFDGVGTSPTQGFRAVFLLEGLFILALCPVIGVLLLFSRRLRYTSNLDLTPCSSHIVLDTLPAKVEPLQDEAKHMAELEKIQASDIPKATAIGVGTDSITTHHPASQNAPSCVIAEATTGVLVDDEKDRNENTMFSSLRRFSSYCASLANVAILNRSNGGAGSMIANIRTLQRFHSGFGRWVSSLLRRIMVFLFGGMGVDDGAFDLISAGTSSRETFICGVLIVSNTVIIQIAVISLIASLKAPDSQQTASSELKVVPTLPGLPTLAGGVSGAISSVLWSICATETATQATQATDTWGRRWKNKPWWVPALLSTCLAITLAGLALAVVANTMVPEGDCGVWIIYAATIVTYAGSTPQLPLALLQIYTVLDAELGRHMDVVQSFETAEADGEQVGPDYIGDAVRTTSASGRAVRWERIGVMISTLTTIAGSQLLTVWVFLMPDEAQKVFLFASAVLAIGGSVWMMFRHTWLLRQRRRVSPNSL